MNRDRSRPLISIPGVAKARCSMKISMSMVEHSAGQLGINNIKNSLYSCAAPATGK